MNGETENSGTPRPDSAEQSSGPEQSARSQGSPRKGSRKRRREQPQTLPSYFNPRNGRELALAVLHHHELSGRFVTDLLSELAPPDLDRHERGMATELACGIIRRRIPLGLLLQQHCSRPRHQVDGLLWTLMKLGAYQLVYGEGIPPHAAVNETVELCRRIGQGGWTGFLNGVLRGLQRSLLDEWTEIPAADAVPVSGGRCRKLAAPVFADPAEDLAGWINQALSIPGWLAKRWTERMPEDKLLALGWWFLEPSPVSLRVNLLKTTRDDLLAAFREAEVEAVPGQLPMAIRMVSNVPVTRLPGFAEGWFTVQDESAMHAALLLAPRSGDSVLDLCAAPGTKTTHLAELMQDRGKIIAADVSSQRLRRIDQNIERLGLSCVQTVAVERDSSDLPEGPFTRILIDAPCSNTGVLGKRPEARWRIDAAQMRELPQIQERLLLAASRQLAPGGRLVYSTCSIEPEENQDVVRRVESVIDGLELVKEQQQYPGYPGDGGYQALLQRRE